MTDVPPPQVPPPSPVAAPAPSPGRPAWQTWGAAVLAVAVGVVGAALVADNASADGEERPAPSRTVRPVPVLGGSPGSALSSAVSAYALTAFSDPTRGLVLSAWGAAFSDLFGPGGEGPPGGAGGAFVDDPRLGDGQADPSFEDDCADEPEGDGCPDPDDSAGATVDGEAAVGPNRAMVYAFPAADAALADECAFGDVTAAELPIAVITTNPSDVRVTIGDEVTEVPSDEAEIEEFEQWRASGEVARPPSTFVAHCLAVPRPELLGPLEIAVEATDDAGQLALASTSLLAAPDGQLPATVTPIDDTMVRIDVPLPAGDADAVVRAIPLLDPLATSCTGLPPAAPLAGWRAGNSLLTSDPPGPGERPYLDDFPRTRRVTVPLPEGEPSLVCIIPSGGLAPSSAVVTPPDARRLRLGVTEVVADRALGPGEVEVRGTFAELGWTPCGTALPAVEAGATVDLVADGAMCASAGDSGAIAAAGGVLDLTVRTAATALHRVRIALSAAPGGEASEPYRIPIPAASFDGVLCTEGAELPDCVAPEGDVVLGTLMVTATWDEGPTGTDDWSIQAVAVPPTEGAAPAED